MARLAIVIMLLIGAGAGAFLYYQQVYAFYEEIGLSDDAVQLTALATDAPEAIALDSFEGIDAVSSPLRYRACFQTSMTLDALTATYETLPNGEPRVAPGWFDCFDAEQIGADLRGDAIAFMGIENVTYGIDRVVAIYPDGRGFSWHQINACGEVVFNREPVPAGCPTPPESLN